MFFNSFSFQDKFVTEAKSLLMTRHVLEFMGLRMVIKCENVVIQHFTSTSSHRKIELNFFVYFQFLESLIWRHLSLCYEGKKLIDDNKCIRVYGLKDGDQI